MGDAIGQILPFAVGVAVSPMPIVAMVLMLITPKAKLNGFVFLFGWMVGVALAGAACLLVIGPASTDDGAPSDGTLVGDLNAQCFKMLAMPAGLSLVWLRVRFGSGSLADRAARFRDLAVRGTWAASFLVGFTLIELEKTYHFIGMNAVLVAGERAWLNHVIHLVSAVLAWFLTDQLAFEPLTHAEIALERELDSLEPHT